MALFLEFHPQSGGTTASDRAKARIAYRSFHPEPIEFTQKLVCEGGEVDKHNPNESHHIMAGRTVAEPCRSNVLPGAVNVRRGPDGAQVEAHIQFGQTGLQLNDKGRAVFSVAFPDGEDFKCSCC